MPSAEPSHGTVSFPDLVGLDLGTRQVSYTESDAILYALAIGVPADDIPYVYERGLRVMPTYALPLGLWTADAASAAGAFVPAEALHGAQSLVVHTDLPPSGTLEIAGAVTSVWDTGKSALIDITAECAQFTATYTIIVPGKGGFGGSRPPRSPEPDAQGSVEADSVIATSPQQAALYRLTGDRHAIHIDPMAAAAAGFEAPILHGLCTLGMAVREVGRAVGVAPRALRELSARFVAPVVPGDDLRTTTRSWTEGDRRRVAFTTAVGATPVLADGSASFRL
ncbi:MaoC/PaaZ C-terminal domain-containing protein [Nocardia sp. NPDC005366]|uniref:MaoC/PaaZ C-terminal domain-containing protein n=1 Tax=Nocardia sp. NPDC005366 TaxID=3156878 RepID=UPI00339E7609